MHRIWIKALLFLGLGEAIWGDAISGPHRTTIQALPWGSIYFEPGVVGSYELEETYFGFRFRSEKGDVAIQRINPTDFRLTCGAEFLVLYENPSGLDFRGLDRTWSLRTAPGRCVWVSSDPKETLEFERNSFRVTISGNKGVITISAQTDAIQIQGPMGTTIIRQMPGRRMVSGPPVHQIPYLGRGFWLSFHGIGVFVDLSKHFPLPEIAEWTDWRAILAP